MRTGLPAAVRFYAQAERAGERADAVRAYLAEEPGRDAEVTRRLPEDLPPDTWVWFTDSVGTGAGYLHPDGRWRIYASGATLRAEDGGRLLSGVARTFVVARPVPARPAGLGVADGIPSVGEEELSRLPAAHRGWTRDETAESLTLLETRLVDAGSRALALVTLQEPDQRLVAFNRAGRIRWSEFPSGRPAVPRRDARAGAYVALDRDGALLDPPTEPAGPGSGASSFPRLYAAVVASVRGPRAAEAAPRSPATGERARPARPPLFLDTPRERRPANTETDDIGLTWVRSPHSRGDCVEVAMVRRRLTAGRR
jgi:hypothetical protein